MVFRYPFPAMSSVALAKEDVLLFIAMELCYYPEVL
jgi:hypothetical protein